MKQITKEELIHKIENKEIKNSRGIWKLLSNENKDEIYTSFGNNKVEKLYNWLHEIKERKCKHCNSQDKLSFHNFNKGYLNFCSPKCASAWYRVNETEEQNVLKSLKISESLNSKSKNEWKEIITKQKQTKLKKYGDENYNNSCKQQQTMLIKYGFTSPLQVPKFNIKFKKSLSIKDWSKAIDSRQKTLLINTGYKHQLQNPLVRDKIKKTNLKRYGVENPSQSPDIAEKKLKSSYLKKEYILPSGKIELVQGYEDFEIDNLLKSYNEKDLIINQIEMPEIWYIGLDNKNHRYIPDIFIPKENKIIEVKSTRTMDLHLEINWLKKQRCLEMGFDFEFRIYDRKMNLVDEKEFL